MPALDFGDSPTKSATVNNGHTIQVNLPAGNSLPVGDQRYELLQFHSHTPSEEALNGTRKPVLWSKNRSEGILAKAQQFGN